MAASDPGWMTRARDLHQRSHPVVRRVLVSVVGVALLVIGAALLVLPGPGLLVMAAGVAVLSLEFVWASRLVDHARLIIERLRRRSR